MNLARIRKLSGLSQTLLAERIGVSQSTISRAESLDGKVTLQVYIDCTRELDCTLGDIFSEDFRDEEMRLIRAFRSMSPERRRGWFEALGVAEGPAA